MPAISKKYSDLDHAYHVHSFTDLSKHKSDGATMIDHGDGVYLVDKNGNRYLDAMSSLWCATLGYSEQRLIDAAQTQMGKLPYSHSFRGRSNEKLSQLAEKIVEISPEHLTKVFFAGSGSEANESAIKMVWAYHKSHGNSQKRKVISRLNAYHGSTIFSSHLSGMSSMHEYTNMEFQEILYASCPNYLTDSREGESETEFASSLATELEIMIDAEGADTIAAFIAEPVMGVGGVILPPKTYFHKIQNILKKNNILLIADEVICGFGRTGEMFGSTTFDIKPDVITVAKGISSAYFPISATIISEEIYDCLLEISEEKGVFSHGFTYSGHPVAAAVALETIKILEERNIPRHVGTIGEFFKSELQKLHNFQNIANIRGVGLMAAFDLVPNNEHQQKFDPTIAAGSKFMELAEKQCLFVRAVGDTIVIAPPLVITNAEISIMMERLEATASEFKNIL